GGIAAGRTPGAGCSAVLAVRRRSDRSRLFFARSVPGLRTAGRTIPRGRTMTERDVFIAALQKDDPAQRQAYLDEACAGQPGLRRQVEHLLRLHEGAGSFLEEPAAAAADTGALPGAAEQGWAPEAPRAAIGPYKRP